MHRSVSGSSDGGRGSEGRALDSAGDEPGRLPLHPHAGPPHPPLLHHSSASGLPCKDDGLLQSCTEMLSHWILHTANTRYSLEPVKLSLHCWHLSFGVSGGLPASVLHDSLQHVQASFCAAGIQPKMFAHQLSDQHLFSMLCNRQLRSPLNIGKLHAVGTVQ